MSLRLNRFLVVLLAVFVLFAQQGVNLHALSHAVQDVSETTQSRQDPSAPTGHKSCEDCLSFAAAGAALVASSSRFALHSSHIDSTSVRPSHDLRRTVTAYQSRAPPFISLV